MGQNPSLIVLFPQRKEHTWAYNMTAPTLEEFLFQWENNKPKMERAKAHCFNERQRKHNVQGPVFLNIDSNKY